MRDNDASAFRLLLERYEGAVQDRINQRIEFNETYRALNDVKRQVSDYGDLVQELDKALKAAKVKKRPSLPEWHIKRFARDEDIPF
jgi:non-homologous end joining protein Ku